MAMLDGKSAPTNHSFEHVQKAQRKKAKAKRMASQEALPIKVAMSEEPKDMQEWHERRARALYVKWNRCPVPADIAMDTGECNGFCAVDWLATRGDFSGELYNRSDGAVRVPFGKGDSPDKRRGGAWYVGVQALAGESAEFELSASLFMPPAGGGDACTRYTAACAADSSRGAYLGGAPATPPALVEEDNSMAATMVRRGVPAVAALVGLCLIIVFIRRLLIKRGRAYRGALRV